MAEKKASPKSDAAKKPAARPGKALESKTGAGEAVAQRSKDAKKAQPAAKASPASAASKKTSSAAKKSASSPKSAPPSAAKTKGTAKSKAPAAVSKPKASSGEPSIARKVIRKVKSTAEGAVSLATSMLGKDDKKSRAKRG